MWDSDRAERVIALGAFQLDGEWAVKPRLSTQMRPGRQSAILLVGKDAESLAALESALAPIHVVRAASRQEALEHLGDPEIAGLVDDGGVSWSDRSESAASGRAKPATRTVPILVVTERTQAALAAALCRLDALVDFISKPLDGSVRAKVSSFWRSHVTTVQASTNGGDEDGDVAAKALAATASATASGH